MMVIPSCYFQHALPGRKTFAKDLHKASEALEKDVQDHVLATAHIWSINKSFVGVTIHWINAGNLMRESSHSL